MNELRKVEVFRDSKWINVRLSDVHKGELFRVFEIPEMTPVVTNSGKSEYIALSEPYIGPIGPDKSDVWIIETEK